MALTLAEAVANAGGNGLYESAGCSHAEKTEANAISLGSHEETTDTGSDNSEPDVLSSGTSSPKIQRAQRATNAATAHLFPKQDTNLRAALRSNGAKVLADVAEPTVNLRAALRNNGDKVLACLPSRASKATAQGTSDRAKTTPTSRGSELLAMPPGLEATVSKLNTIELEAHSRQKLAARATELQKAALRAKAPPTRTEKGPRGAAPQCADEPNSQVRTPTLLGTRVSAKRGVTSGYLTNEPNCQADWRYKGPAKVPLPASVQMEMAKAAVMPGFHPDLPLKVRVPDFLLREEAPR